MILLHIHTPIKSLIHKNVTSDCCHYDKIMEVIDFNAGCTRISHLEAVITSYSAFLSPCTCTNLQM